MTQRVIPARDKDITATIQLSAIERNVNRLRTVGSTDIIPVLKADAYGHGILPIARFLRSLGISYLAVATLGEALLLRNAGDRGRILAWLYDIHGPELLDAFRRDIDVAIFDDTTLNRFIACIPKSKRVRVTVFVDTGFNRTGIPYENAMSVCKKVAKHPQLEFVGLMSHLACAQQPNQPRVHEQLRKFRLLRKNLAAIGIVPEMVHIANTAGCVNYDVSDFTHSRSGAGLFGINGNFESVATVRSHIIQLKTVAAHEGIGYNAEFITPRAMRIAVAPIGYADILSQDIRQLYVKGTARNILGAINMDQVVFEASETDRLGDTVGVFGKGAISISEFDAPDSIACRMSNYRINRVYT